MPAPKASLTLAQVAEHLGVHYMTAYRYVRTGRLPATRRGREWVVEPADLAAFEAAAHGAAPRGRRRADYPRELERRLLDADESGAWAVIENALGSGMEVEEVLLDVVVPALSHVGASWEAGDIDVADEHRATAVATRLIGRLGPLFARRGRKRGRVLLGTPAGDNHGLPTAVVRDLLRGRGFEVIDLGANVPTESWERSVRELSEDASIPLVGVGMCATTVGNERNVAAGIAAIRRGGPVPVVLGGHAVPDEAAARRAGADLFSASSPAAVAAFEALAADSAA